MVFQWRVDLFHVQSITSSATSTPPTLFFKVSYQGLSINATNLDVTLYLLLAIATVTFFHPSVERFELATKGQK